MPCHAASSKCSLPIKSVQQSHVNAAGGEDAGLANMTVNSKGRVPVYRVNQAWGYYIEGVSSSVLTMAASMEKEGKHVRLCDIPATPTIYGTGVMIIP